MMGDNVRGLVGKFVTFDTPMDVRFHTGRGLQNPLLQCNVHILTVLQNIGLEFLANGPSYEKRHFSLFRCFSCAFQLSCDFHFSGAFHVPFTFQVLFMCFSLFRCAFHVLFTFQVCFSCTFHFSCVLFMCFLCAFHFSSAFHEKHHFSYEKGKLRFRVITKYNVKDQTCVHTCTIYTYMHHPTYMCITKYHQHMRYT